MLRALLTVHGEKRNQAGTLVLTMNNEPRLCAETRSPCYRSALLTLLISVLIQPALGQESSDQRLLVDEDSSPIKFALTSDAWGENVNTGIRVFANNTSAEELVLRSVVMLGEEGEARLNPDMDDYDLQLDLPIRAGGWAETLLDFVDMSYGSDCVEDAMHDESSQWKLVEISNYSLNPSVRSRIIENTDSFRIFSCPRLVQLNWQNQLNGEQFSDDIWVLYHFETKREQ